MAMTRGCRVIGGCGRRGSIAWSCRAVGAPSRGSWRLHGRAGCYDRQPVKASWTPWQGSRRTKLEASGASGCRLKNSVLTNKYRKEDKKKKRKKRKERVLQIFYSFYLLQGTVLPNVSAKQIHLCYWSCL
jgi:hypothetical protein